MRIMIWGRRRSGGWVEVKHNGNRMGGQKKKRDERWSLRTTRSGDINYKEGLDSCQEQIALLGKGKIFEPLMFL